MWRGFPDWIVDVFYLRLLPGSSKLDNSYNNEEQRPPLLQQNFYLAKRKNVEVGKKKQDANKNKKNRAGVFTHFISLLVYVCSMGNFYNVSFLYI